MSDRKKQYPFDEIEARWQRYWEETKSFRAPGPGEEGFDESKESFYVLDMFPYPSGDGLHVGHVEGYTATDIVARYKRKCGFRVLHPMGWDAFGLPAEQYAIRTGQHPRITTERNTEKFRQQLKRLGFSYDWDREINTTSPEYFKWTQWIFLQLYGAYFDVEADKARPIEELEKRRRTSHPDEDERSFREYIDQHRLAYVAEVPVNWCQELGTVLANEEVENGLSEVGGFPVERRPMRQWMLRITSYTERLLNELDGLDWPENIKKMQRDWIGRSEGAQVSFTVQGGTEVIEVFTTRPDTLFGATYMVLAPEHPLVDKLTTEDQRAAVTDYQRGVTAKSDLERSDLSKEKSGVSTGGYAINPVNGKALPVWIADYVLMTYGTGAIMAVPGHDERDREFAEAFDLEVIEVVEAPEGFEGSCFTGDGISIRSEFLDGLPTAEAKTRIIEWLEAEGKGERTINYKLRDWLFSRQRYWGEPFPIVWENGRHHAVDEAELPVKAPEMIDFKPTGTADPPLSRAKDWVQYSPTAMRETNTMPQWAGSCWYYLRFMDPRNSERFVSKQAEEAWTGAAAQSGLVDLYIGGAEHAVLHLLYSRFWHKVLYDLGFVGRKEPFQRLVNQGLIMGPDGQKMSKSRGNVVNPDDVIENYGADSLRLYEMNMAPLEKVKPWSERGVEGLYRFLSRVWRLFMAVDQEGEWHLSSAVVEGEADADSLRLLHETIRKVGQDTERLAFNTAIPQMMIFVKGFIALEQRPLFALRAFLELLSPYAPHLAEELNARVNERFPGGPMDLTESPWPSYDEEILKDDRIAIVVQVNGKLRDRVQASATESEESIIERARASRAKEHFKGVLVKTIYVPGKLVNFVIRPS